MTNTTQFPFSFSADVTMDLVHFLSVLRDSLGLDIQDKTKVIRAIPNLTQAKIEALLDVWVEEAEEWNKKDEAEISLKKAERLADWQVLEEEFNLPNLDIYSLSNIEMVSAYRQGTEAHSTALRTINRIGRNDTTIQNKAVKADKLNGPRALCKKIDKLVIGQENAREKLLTTLYYHKRLRNRCLTNPAFRKKNNFREPPILLTGPTACGKTHLIRSACQLLKLNPVIIDASTMVRSGIVGTSVGDIGKIILDQSGGDKSKAELSVVFLDEFDKLLLGERNNCEILTQLLTMLEGSAPLRIDNDRANERGSYPSELDTSRMLFILGGAFSIHMQEHEAKPIGFLSKQESKNKVDQERLKTFNMPAELRGRIGQVIAMDKLTPQQLKQIFLTSPTSPMRFLNDQLGLFDCYLDVEQEALDQLVQHPLGQDLGARGMFQVFSALPAVHEYRMRAPEEPGTCFTIKTEHLA